MPNSNFLIDEYKRYAEAFWRNEEVGEKRLNYFITLTTAIIAAIVTLLTSEELLINGSKSDNSTNLVIYQISTAVLSGIFLFGLVTYYRMLQRDHVTDEYKSILDYLRNKITQNSEIYNCYNLPFTDSRHWLLRGSLSISVSVMNSIILAVIPAIWLEGKWKWIGIVGIFFTSFILHAFGIKGRGKSSEDKSQKFRAGVGAVIVNQNQLVLALERKDLPGSWQLPQGGMDLGEIPIQAVKREICEETGIKMDYLEQITDEPRVLTYELPEKYRSKKTGRGQTQYWFLFKFTRTDSEINLDRSKEFKDWKWMSMEELVEEVVDFRKPVYQNLSVFLSKNQTTD